MATDEKGYRLYRYRAPARLLARPAQEGEAILDQFTQPLFCSEGDMLVIVGPLIVRMDRAVFDRTFELAEEEDST